MPVLKRKTSSNDGHRQERDDSIYCDIYFTFSENVQGARIMDGIRTVVDASATRSNQSCDILSNGRIRDTVERGGSGSCCNEEVPMKIVKVSRIGRKSAERQKMAYLPMS